MPKRIVGIIDCTPKRLPKDARKKFDELCIDPGLTVPQIRTRMISEGFRLTISAVAKHASRVRREHGIRRQVGRPPTLAGRCEAVAQLIVCGAVLLAGDGRAKDAIRRAAEIAGINFPGGKR